MSELITKTEGYTLPSKGLIYSKEFDPHVQLRSMTTMEEMQRLSPTNTPYKQMSDIIEKCLLTKLPVKVYDMCIGDYEYLMHKLRVVSHGPDFKSTTMCPKCGRIITPSYNLDDLKVLDFDTEEFKKLRTLELKQSKKTVLLNFQTPRILDQISLDADEMRKQTKDTKTNFEYLTSLKWAIATVDGVELGLVEKEEFVKNLPAGDANSIQNRIKKLNTAVGLDTRVNIKCDKCGYDISTFFRMGPEFFRPEDE